MKLTGITDTIQSISRNRQIRKIEKHRKEVNELVDLSALDCTVREDGKDTAAKQLYYAQEGLANYAKANDVKIRISSLPKNVIFPEGTVMLSVRNRTGHIIPEFQAIDADTTKVSTIQREKDVFLVDKDGLDYKATGVETQDDNFLRRIYRGVSTLTNKVKNNLDKK